MNIRIIITLFMFLSLVSVPLSAQHLCEDCLNEAKHLLAQCLEGAISEEDKKSCVERQQARSKGCESSQCMTERDARKMDKSVEQKSQGGGQVKEERRER
ncbi:hypothetical protein ACYX34_20040 [Nitrospira sp. CMX1]